MRRVADCSLLSNAVGGRKKELSANTACSGPAGLGDAGMRERPLLGPGTHTPRGKQRHPRANRFPGRSGANLSLVQTVRSLHHNAAFILSVNGPCSPSCLAEPLRRLS